MDTVDRDAEKIAALNAAGTMTQPRQREFKEYGNIDNCVDYFLDYAVPRDKRILDIGTNLGSFPNALHARGYTDVRGIDVQPAAIAHGKQVYPAIADRLLAYDGRTLPFADGSFDAVTMFDVIEHIPDVREFLPEVARVLADDGLFVFQTPNIYVNSVWATIEWRSFEWRKDHCSLQSLRSLRRLLRDAGLSQVRVDKVSIDTEFNRAVIREHLGGLGTMLLRLSRLLPLGLYPNFYGSAVKAP